MDVVIREVGPDRALFLLNELEEQLRSRGIRSSVQPYSAYRSTIPVDKQGAYPGDLAMEERITSIIRWNALAMVVRANQAHGKQLPTTCAPIRNSLLPIRTAGFWRLEQTALDEVILRTRCANSSRLITGILQ